jgi:hypothetical protein
MPKYYLQISAKILSWPQYCACCGGASDTHFRASASKSTGKKVVTTRTSWWEVPYCSTCLHHVQKYQAAAQILVNGVVLGIIFAIIVAVFATSLMAGLIAGIVAIIGGVILSNNMKTEATRLTQPKCISPDTAVEYTGWYGTAHDFVFKSRSYAEQFAAINRRKTMSDIREI